MIDNHYFGNINYYNILSKNKNIVINPDFAYQKGWLSNKCSIVGANGIIDLSVPLLGGRNQKTAYKDVKIAYTQNWQQQHFRAIKSCYGNAPYFDFYLPVFEKIFTQKFERLFDLNIHILEKMIHLLKLDLKIEIVDTPFEIAEILFTKANIQQNQELNNSKIVYPQVFEDRLGFVPNLSIIDLVMCMGPQAKELLQHKL